MINPELQFSGNNEVATVKLDIFGEIVVTLGTTPQGQGHETTAAQVVADILGCSVDDVHVRAGHDSYWNSHAGFSGTYAIAVRGHRPLRGEGRDRHARRADQAARLGDPRRRAGGGARARRGHGADQGQPGSGAAVHGVRRDHQREQRGPAGGSRRHAQLPLRLPAAVRGAGRRAEVRQPDAHLRGADPRGRRRDRPRDGLLRDRRLRGRRRLRRAHPPADRRGPGDGCDGAGARRRRCTSRSSTTRRATC